MLKAVKRGIDLFLHGSPPTYRDGTPMPAEEHEEWLRRLNEESAELDQQMRLMRYNDDHRDDE